MTLVMSYVILVSAAIGACAAAFDVIAERRRMPRRWLWLAALGVTMAATALVMVLPISAPVTNDSTVLTGSALVLGSPVTQLATPTTRVPLDAVLLSAADSALPFVWLIASAALLVAIASGQRTLRRVRQHAHATEVAGQPVLVTESIGPAVAGIRSPVVFVPTWVLALDETSQRLLLAHEAEHVKGRDTALLFAGALAAALVPWNPVVWWMVRRLRLAVEQDCDGRVLERHPAVRRYADLLLLTASRPSVMTRLLAAHFGEHSSDLVRRIETMTRASTISWRRLVPATAIASFLLTAACVTDRPAPVAPIDLRNEVETRNAEATFTEMERSDAALEQTKVALEEFAAVLSEYERSKAAYERINGKLLNLDTELRADSSFVEIEKSRLPYKISDAATKAIQVPEIRISYAESEMIVTGATLKLDSSLSSAVEVAGTAREIPVDELAAAASRYRAPDASTLPSIQGADKIVLYHPYDRNGTNRVVPPNVIIYSSDGSEIARFLSNDNAMGSISLFGVETIKNQVTGDCAPLSCPLTRITLKPGFKLVSYAEWKERRK